MIDILSDKSLYPVEVLGEGGEGGGEEDWEEEEMFKRDFLFHGTVF